MAKLSINQVLLSAYSNAKKGEIAEAKKLYKTVLKAFPKNKRALKGLAALTKTQKPTISNDPSQDIVNQLLNIYRQGQLNRALEQAEIIVEQYPETFIVWNILGSAAAQINSLDKAKMAFQKAIYLKPHIPDSYNNLGNVLRRQGMLKEALATYKKALALHPSYAEAYNNMGNCFKDQGKLKEAIGAYKKAVSISPDYSDAYYNIGNAFQEQGNLKESLDAYKKTLTLKPDYAEAYNNMGNCFKDQGKSKEALDAYSKAVSFKPDYADAYYNIGVTLKDQGNEDEAIKAWKKTLTLKPDYPEVYNNFGNTLKDQGKLNQALEAYIKALSLRPDYTEVYYNTGLALMSVTINKPSSKLQGIITSILKHRRYVRPIDISAATMRLLKFDPIIKKVFRQSFDCSQNIVVQKIVLELSKIPLLLKFMSVCPLSDLEFEVVLRKIRSLILESLSEINEDSDFLRFQSALALQCFINEYIYLQDDSDSKTLKKLEISIEKSLSIGKQPSTKAVLCLASFKSLKEYRWCDLLAIKDDIEDVFAQQVLESKQEDLIRSSIPSLIEITNTVSSRVREQYEANPYPRWVNLRLPLKPYRIYEMFDLANLKCFDDKINDVMAPDILIAGCGTGQHAIGTAATFKDTKILAIDLSLSSLAYAQRKTEEIGLTNIDYMQADILDLRKLERQFDIIESVGVLHHMENPLVGWKVLTDCLKSGGLMKLGLYSELARKDIIKIREEIAELGVDLSGSAMQAFRNDMIKSKKDQYNQVINSSDFYSLSTLRDLLFHVQEHRFTLTQIKESLLELGLRFCGFQDPDIVRKHRRKFEGVECLYDLDKWLITEESNPTMFSGMYQFWCQKIA